MRHFLKDKLPDHMVPAVFVLLDTLPLLSNGKIDRRALLAPDRSRPELEKSFVAPRDDLELQLAHIWEEILGIRPIGVRDNFFELGGHSLLAIRLFALIEKRMGKKLPLTAVFQGATVEHLADVLRHQAGPQSSLVAIQPGGSRPPLFLVHPAGGHVFPYIHLAQFLGPDQPCYGLQAKGLEDGQKPHTRIEDMAAHYIQALQTVQPTEPYLLGGWSMGGVVAFEMAQQLHAQGQRVALLALLDSRIAAPDETFPEEDSEMILLLETYFGISFGPMESLAQRPKDEQSVFILEHAKSAGLVPAELGVSQARRFVELLRSDLRATQNYEPHLYPGRVTLFKASETLGGTSPDPTFGWSEWASGGVEVHVIPGNHANLVYEPHVEVLAAKLTACLNQAQSAEGVESGATANDSSKDKSMSTVTAFDSWIAFRKPNPRARLRLFCFPYAGSGASIFRIWSDSLPADVELCPVELPGRGTRPMETPFTQLAPLVEALARALLPVLDKPFAFFGHSFGALVGFELARQLRRESGVQPVRLFVSADRAPQFFHRDRPMHALPEREFLIELRRLNGIPGEVLEEAELMQIMIPILRADLAVYETYEYSTELPLDCAITTYGGLQDHRVSQGHLEAWRDQTNASFSLRMFPGDHFFWHTTQPFFLRALSQDLRGNE
jgi:surfactin synthase thioesterase subunit/acyl carrier protein